MSVPELRSLELELGDRVLAGILTESADTSQAFSALFDRWVAASRRAGRKPTLHPKRRGRPTKCPRGHPFDEANTYSRKNGTRYCLRYAAEDQRRRRGRRGHPAGEESSASGRLASSPRRPRPGGQAKDSVDQMLEQPFASCETKAEP